MASTATRTCYFVAFAYGADSGQPQGVRETTVYLPATVTSRRAKYAAIAEVIAGGVYLGQGRALRPSQVAVYEAIVVDAATTREYVDQVRAAAVAEHAARRGA
jgi:hypothetical protein